MNEMEARISIRVEVNALITALDSYGEDRLSAINDALSIRAERRHIFGSEVDENRLELWEGLAQYTEFYLNPRRFAFFGFIPYLEMWAAGMVRGISLEHAFGYLSGALYAFLLDEFDAAWKERVHGGSDLGLMLQEAVGISEIRPFNEVNLNNYDHALISIEEIGWATTREAMLQEIKEILTSQPILHIYANDVNLAFSGQRFTFADIGTVFRGDVEFSGSFGRLFVQNGDLIAHQDGFIVVAANDMRIDGNQAFGPNWELTLNDGYEIQPEPDGNGFRVTGN